VIDNNNVYQMVNNFDLQNLLWQNIKSEIYTVFKLLISRQG